MREAVMRGRGLIGGALALGMMGALGLGSPVIAGNGDNRAVIPAEQQDIRKQQRALDRLRRRIRGPVRSGKREMLRRQRQIAARQLRIENGLAIVLEG
jgi:hypothetical protein